MLLAACFSELRKSLENLTICAEFPKRTLISSGDRSRHEVEVPLYISSTTLMSRPNAASVSTNSLITCFRRVTRFCSGVRVSLMLVVPVTVGSRLSCSSKVVPPKEASESAAGVARTSADRDGESDIGTEVILPGTGGGAILEKSFGGRRPDVGSLSSYTLGDCMIAKLV